MQVSGVHLLVPQTMCVCERTDIQTHTQPSELKTQVAGSQGLHLHHLRIIREKERETNRWSEADGQAGRQQVSSAT